MVRVPRRARRQRPPVDDTDGRRPGESAPSAALVRPQRGVRLPQPGAVLQRGARPARRRDGRLPLRGGRRRRRPRRREAGRARPIGAAYGGDAVTTFPGGTSVTRVLVYAGGGTPHLHTTSTEAYVVIGGAGAVQTLDPSGFRETPLEAGGTVWFTPGVIHRAINHGGLELLVVMSNAGLPESGDAVLTFPPEVVADPERYRSAATLVPPV